MKLSCRILLLIIAVSVAFTSCNSNKPLINTETKASETITPCAENGMSDSNYLRASASATSSSISLAHEKALASAKSELGKKIIDKTLASANQYASEIGLSNKTTFIKDMELIANKAIDMMLKEISPTCENYSETNSRYTAYISVEISRKTMIDKIYNLTVTDIPNLNKEKFKVILNK